jgi:uncharacterized membrane protein
MGTGPGPSFQYSIIPPVQVLGGIDKAAEHGVTMLSELYEAVFQFLGYFCHQLPERSFFIFGAQFPLCIRCSALLAGGLGAFAYVFVRRPLPSIRICIALTLPMIIEIAVTGAGLAESGNPLRGVNGLLFGFFFLMGSMVWLSRWGDGPKTPTPPKHPCPEAS